MSQSRASPPIPKITPKGWGFSNAVCVSSHGTRRWNNRNERVFLEFGMIMCHVEDIHVASLPFSRRFFLNTPSLPHRSLSCPSSPLHCWTNKQKFNQYSLSTLPCRRGPLIRKFEPLAGDYGCSGCWSRFPKEQQPSLVWEHQSSYLVETLNKSDLTWV